VKDASLLYEVPHQERDERYQSNNHEKWTTSDSGHLSRMRNKDVPNWQSITLIKASGCNKGWVVVKKPALFDYLKSREPTKLFPAINWPVAKEFPISESGIYLTIHETLTVNSLHFGALNCSIRKLLYSISVLMGAI
jgi:hypothetical protein